MMQLFCFCFFFVQLSLIASDTYCDAFHFITVKSAELTHAHIHSLIQCFFVQVCTKEPITQVMGSCVQYGQLDYALSS